MTDRESDLRLHDLVAAQAERSPDAIAVSSPDGEALTFRQLDLRSRHLARRLEELGVGPESIVGIRLERSPEMVVALLGILVAGGAYLPLEPSTPTRRLAFMLREARPKLIVTSRECAGHLPTHDARVVFLESMSQTSDSAADSSRGDASLRRFLLPDHPAYVLYTSGSTGRPKAVVITHRGICNHRHWMQAALPLSAADRILHKATLGFDASVWEIFAPLTAGAQLVLAPAGSRRDPGQLIDVLRRARITVLHAVASLLRRLVDHPDFRRCQDLRRVSNGGEALSVELSDRFLEILPKSALYNLYGPTEATIQAAFSRCRPAAEHCLEPRSTVPIGRPIANARLCVLGRDLRPILPGNEGLLHIGGLGLARGYLRRPGLSAERFVPDPFVGLRGGLEDPMPGQRLYATGDRARWNADGSLMFEGRLDHQVKIRGFRVELGEIERVLAEHPAVLEIAVHLAPGQATENQAMAAPRLAAYIVARTASSDAPEAASHEATSHEVGWREEHVEHWRSIYDSTYGQSASHPGEASDLAGWDSSYTGRPLAADHMAEAVHHTVQRVLRLGGKRVFEIGCGTGLLLFRIAPSCRHYLGTDLSPAVVNAVRSRLGRDLAQVDVRALPADDFEGIAPGSFDVVFCNSVIGHFPSTGYLLDVLEGMVRATAPGGSILIGDVRNLPLLEALTASVETFKAPSDLPLIEVRQRIRRNLRREDRLVVEPAFFAALPRRLRRITGVRIWPKGGRLLNELTRFRYDVVLELDGPESAEAQSDSEIDPIDWRRERLTPNALRHYLERENPRAVVVMGVPNARVGEDVALLDRLRTANVTTIGELRAIMSEEPRLSSHGNAVEPSTFDALFEGTSYSYEISWARCDPSGDFDLAIWRTDRPRPVGLNACLLPSRARLAKPWTSFTNDPLRKRLYRSLVPRWRSFLAERLPEHMLPSAYVLLEALPQTPAGKLDRRALPTPETSRPELNSGFTAPRSAAEQQLATIWQEVLGIDEIGIHDNFFELGGHSLLGTQVMTRIRERFGVELPLRSLFDGPTVAEMGTRLTTGQQSGRTVIERLPRTRDSPAPDLPLSFAQQRLWFLHQLHPESSAYNGPRAFRLRGKLDVAALDRSIRSVGRRHESLRTTFSSTGGRPRQVIAETVSLRLPAVDLGQLAGRDGSASLRDQIAWRLIAQESARPFDLSRGPLLRCLLIRLDREHHLLLLNLHHIITDSWSEEILYREIVTLYAALIDGRPSPLPELPIQYADFAVWQRAWLTGEELETQLAYWRQQLRDLPPLRFPPAHTRATAASGETRHGRHQAPSASDWGTIFAFALPEGLSGSLTALSLRSGTSLFITLLTAFMVLLHRYTGQQDLVIGSPSANRNQEEIEGLIGFFVNMLVMRGAVSGELEFLELLRRVREVALGSYAHQDLPFEKLVEELQPERDPSSNPLFQVTFALHNTPRAELALSGLDVSHLDLDFSGVRFDLEVHLWEMGDALSGYCVYRADLLEATAVARLMRHFENLLHAVAENPGSRALELSPLSAAERHQMLVEWNDTRAQWPVAECLHQPFEAQAARTPDRTAVTWQRPGGPLSSMGASARPECLSYRRLDRRANRLARHLQSLGVGPDVRVAIFLDRGPELVVAIFAVLKAGGAYLPLETDDPAQRLAYILEDSAARLLLTREDLWSRLPIETPQVVRLDPGGLPPATSGSSDDDTDSDRPPNEVHADNTAYVLYTSGSTGGPKGVAVPHAAIGNHMRWMQAQLPLRDNDRVLQKTTLGFDASVWEFYAPLQVGAQLILARPGAHRDPAYLTRAIRRHRVTILQVVPSLLRVLLTASDVGHCTSLRRVLCGGEALTPELENDFFSAGLSAELHNVYGPTEATIHATSSACRPVPGAYVPVGRPIANDWIHLLDEDHHPMPIGAPGELCVGGAGLARGYLDRPGLTAERLVPNSQAGQSLALDGPRAPGRLYKTGDQAHYLPDGRLVLIGRLDQQIKIRGFRVEPAEIEAVLGRHAAVRDTLVLGERGERLVAYIVPRAPVGDSVDTLRAEREERWRSLYEDIYDHPARQTSSGPDFTGWNSSYTGRPLPPEEMQEWLDHTVARILALSPKKVLEIGCGTGLLLDRIAPICVRYVGTDFSRGVLRQLGARVRLPQVELLHAAARDFESIENGSFDTVVLNSLAQYLPDVDYLLETLRGAVHATAPGGTVFVGDVRNLRLLDAFCVSIEVGGGSSRAAELRQRMERRRRRERELVIDPAFFLALRRELPRITDVRIEPKYGRYANELNKFRYDVTLRLDRPVTGLATRGEAWIDWRLEGLTLATLRRHLETRRPRVLGLGSVTNERLRTEARLLDDLAGNLGSAAGAAAPDDLRDLGMELGYSVELSWADGGTDGSYDALFRRSDQTATTPDTMAWPRPESLELPVPPLRRLATDPIRAEAARQLVPEWRSYLAQRLPEHMVPSVFMVLDALPLTSNGKLDRQALPAPDGSRPDLETGYLAPRTPTERALIEIWTRVLAIERVGVRDNFFDLGGHSLLAIQVLSRVRKELRIDLPLRSLFDHPTVAALSRHLTTEQQQSAIPAVSSGMEEGRI